jgi:hypothetical protein
MPALTLRRCVPIATSTALQCAHRRMPRMWGIRRCAHGEEFFRFREAKRWENSFQASATDLRAGMGKMSIVRTATEVPDTGRPSLSALWNAMELAIGKLCRSVSAGIGQIGVLSPFSMRPHYFLNRSRRDVVGRAKLLPCKISVSPSSARSVFCVAGRRERRASGFAPQKSLRGAEAVALPGWGPGMWDGLTRGAWSWAGRGRGRLPSSGRCP